MRSAYLGLAFALGVLGVGIGVGCNVPYEVDPNFGAPDSTAGTDTATDGPIDETDTGMPGDGGCKSNLDCAGDLSTPLCNVVSGKCVACLTSDRCAKGQYCNKDGECAAGCRDDSECTTAPKADAGVGDAATDAPVTVLKCDPDTHMCRGCKIDNDCPAGYLCGAADGLCKPGCTPTHACETGRDCCGSTCVDTTKTVEHCGGCGKPCAAAPHALMKCEASTCKVASCEAGWGDCSGGDADGCETDLFTKVETCGGCGTLCTFANGTGICEMGKCKVTSCTTGFGDCDKDGSNGCEQALVSNDHCGACDSKCAPANGTGSCATGTCVLTGCTTGFGDCDMTPGNGCEVNLNTNATHCNTCNNVCPSTGGTPACVGGACKFSSCVAGMGDCDGSGTCSTPITNNVAHCGACGRTCTVANGTPKCTGATCSIDACSTGFGDCNSSYIDGCERALNTVTDCGGCGVPCTRANATATCTTASCAISSCNANFGNCDGIDSNGCEKSLLSDPSACGSCTKSCLVPNGSGGTCAGGVCTYRCNAGFASCNGTVGSAGDTDGCETNFTMPSNSCATATAIAPTVGTEFIGCKPETRTGSAMTVTPRFYTVTVTDNCGGGGCKASNPVRVRFELTNPATADYDLFVWPNATCTGTPLQSINTGLGVAESVTFSAPGSAPCPPTTTFVIEVRYKSVSATPACSNATLTVTSGF